MKKSLWIVSLLVLICAFALSACDDTNRKNQNEDHVHAFGEWTIVKDATCTVKGEEERSCSCGEKETKGIDATGHAEFIDAAVAPACNATGLTEGKHCSKCNEVIIQQHIIPTSSHVFAGDICINCETINLAPGLYDSDDNLIASWETLTNVYGMDVEQNYTNATISQSSSAACNIFGNNDNLAKGTKIVIDDSVAALGDYAFYACANLTNIIFGKNVSKIGMAALTSPFVTDLYIPSSVIYIGEGALMQFAPANITLSKNNKEYVVIDGALYNKNVTRLIRATNANKNKLFDIPTTVTSIDIGAFYGFDFENISIPNGVKTIGEAAFSSCQSIASMFIPDSVTTIGPLSFVGCSKLEYVVIGSGVIAIEDWAFDFCDNLTDVYYKGTREQWELFELDSHEISDATVHFYSEKNLLRTDYSGIMLMVFLQFGNNHPIVKFETVFKKLIRFLT